MASTKNIEPAKPYWTVIHGRGCLVEAVRCVDEEGSIWLCCRKDGSDAATFIHARELNSPSETTILLVEPDPVQRKLANILLDCGDFHVLPTGRAEEAMAIASKEVTTIDILLTTVRVPGIDGPSLSDFVSVFHPAVKTIYASSNTYDELPSQYRKSVPYEAFISKPLSAQSLVERIVESLAKSVNCA